VDQDGGAKRHHASGLQGLSDEKLPRMPLRRTGEKCRETGKNEEVQRQQLTTGPQEAASRLGWHGGYQLCLINGHGVGGTSRLRVRILTNQQIIAIIVARRWLRVIHA